jgi:hypothetical protein
MMLAWGKIRKNGEFSAEQQAFFERLHPVLYWDAIGFVHLWNDLPISEQCGIKSYYLKEA